MFIFVILKFFKVIYKVGEIVLLILVKGCVFKVFLDYLGDLRCRREVRTLIYRALNIY